MNYELKYLKYKQKYLNKKLYGGTIEMENAVDTFIKTATPLVLQQLKVCYSFYYFATKFYQELGTFAMDHPETITASKKKIIELVERLYDALPQIGDPDKKYDAINNTVLSFNTTFKIFFTDINFLYNLIDYCINLQLFESNKYDFKILFEGSFPDDATEQIKFDIQQAMEIRHNGLFVANLKSLQILLTVIKSCLEQKPLEESLSRSYKSCGNHLPIKDLLKTNPLNFFVFIIVSPSPKVRLLSEYTRPTLFNYLIH